MTSSSPTSYRVTTSQPPSLSYLAPKITNTGKENMLKKIEIWNWNNTKEKSIEGIQSSTQLLNFLLNKDESFQNEFLVFFQEQKNKLEENIDKKTQQEDNGGALNHPFNNLKSIAYDNIRNELSQSGIEVVSFGFGIRPEIRTLVENSLRKITPEDVGIIVYTAQKPPADRDLMIDDTTSTKKRKFHVFFRENKLGMKMENAPKISNIEL